MIEHVTATAMRVFRDHLLRMLKGLNEYKYNDDDTIRALQVMTVDNSKKRIKKLLKLLPHLESTDRLYHHELQKICEGKNR